MSETYQVHFKILGNPNIETLDLPSDCGLDTVKTLVSDFCQIPIEDMRILFKGRAFRPADTLQSLGVKNDDTLIVVPNRKNNPPPASDPPAAPIPPAPAAPQQTQQNTQPTAPAPPPQQQENRNQAAQTESQQTRDLRKQLAQIQKVIASVNTSIVELQSKLTDQNINQINDDITNLKAKIDTSVHSLQELSSGLSVNQPQNAPQAPQTQTTNPDVEEFVPRREAPANNGRPQMPPIQNILGSLFGGNRAANNAQAPQAQQDANTTELLFTPEQNAIISADVAKINQEGYIRCTHETYRATYIYSQTSDL
ncbi:Ubiquitin family protein [Trichomonas vaginalis G3]|uniref:Ubiquitin family protein n=1 Tax=Trichomonas vaginalis (strain ATCC PRA-98 / G3) TaxID=412133 RepID=A2ETB1_TRIV3|nr:ubiquitin-like family [Trichomonas vaginalis G3]EAY04101.1 Ubiquitin family protein [Trichomonas vaginalis G3]KAI5503851.1 ubiquitin-like family [Trichomonas vaginalis G3]|eukprot:XP_001316324.1 Ubiquitin family protein [Trichomonas vaginalis G3]